MFCGKIRKSLVSYLKARICGFVVVRIWTICLLGLFLLDFLQFLLDVLSSLSDFFLLAKQNSDYVISPHKIKIESYYIREVSALNQSGLLNKQSNYLWLHLLQNCTKNYILSMGLPWIFEIKQFCFFIRRILCADKRELILGSIED